MKRRRWIERDGANNREIHSYVTMMMMIVISTARLMTTDKTGRYSRKRANWIQNGILLPVRNYLLFLSASVCFFLSLLSSPLSLISTQKSEVKRFEI